MAREVSLLYFKMGEGRKRKSEAHPTLNFDNNEIVSSGEDLEKNKTGVDHEAFMLK